MREPCEMIPAELAALKSSCGAALGRLRKATLRFEASGVEYCGFKVQLARFLAGNAMGRGDACWRWETAVLAGPSLQQGEEVESRFLPEEGHAGLRRLSGLS